MQRREAVQVFREICKCILDEPAVSWAFIEQKKTATNSMECDYELHLKMKVDEATRKNIELLIRKRGLSLRVSKDDFVIYALEAPMEIVA